MVEIYSSLFDDGDCRLQQDISYHNQRTALVFVGTILQFLDEMKRKE